MMCRAVDCRPSTERPWFMTFRVEDRLADGGNGSPSSHSNNTALRRVFKGHPHRMSFVVAAEVGAVDHCAGAVSKLRVSLDDALSSWFEGAFERCLAQCDVIDAQGDGSREALLLRARALLRIDRAAEALRVLERVQPENASSDLDLTRRMLMGAAHTRLEKAERGLEELLELREAMACAHQTIQSEVALNIGLAHYTLRQLSAADAALDEVATGADIIALNLSGRTRQMPGFRNRLGRQRYR